MMRSCDTVSPPTAERDVCSRKALLLLRNLLSMSEIFAAPLKRSITIAGHETALTLEPVFWEALRAAAAEAKLPINALVARIDAERIVATRPPNLASAIRCWLFVHAKVANASQKR
jgi:predicted DNA-binding ribbon-helix-helix protein